MEISSKEFEEKVIEKSRKIPVIVDFYADWCGPCQVLGPILEKLEEKYKGKAVFVKINVDDSPEIANRYDISGIPAVKMFKNGNIVTEFTGLQPEAMVEKWLKKNL